MGYLLEFHGLDWREIQGLLGSGDEAALRAILEAEPHIFVGSPGVSWKGALRELILGPRGRQLASRGSEPAVFTPEESPPEEALALVAIARARGTRIGEVIHTTRGGPKFRRMFQTDFVPPLFGSLGLPRSLLGRPLFGLVRHDYPYWGGLRRAELAELLGDHSLDPFPRVEDPDDEEWLYPLRQALLDARDFGADLLTLYL